MEKLNSIVSVLSVFSSIAVSLVAIIGLLSTIFKPIRKIVLWIYKKAFGIKSKNEEIVKKIDEFQSGITKKVEEVETTLSKKIQEVSDRNDENEKDRIRWEILDFANSCRNKRKHSKEEFKHIIDLKVKYESLLQKTGDRNGVFEEDWKYIEEIYAERLEKNDFLS